MQTTLRSRFLTIAAVVLATTAVPWFVYGVQHGQEYGVKYGLDLKGGASITFRVPAGEGQKQAEVLEEAIRVIRFRLDRLGLGEIQITPGECQFTVDLPGRGKEEIDRIKALMKQVGTLEFHMVSDRGPGGQGAGLEPAERARREREEKAKKGSYVPTPGYRWVAVNPEGGTEKFGVPDRLLEVPEERPRAEHEAAEKALAEAVAAGKPEPELADLRRRVEEAKEARRRAEDQFLWTGRDLASTWVEPDPESPGYYAVHFKIIPERGTPYGDYTGANVHRHMAIVLNGKVEIAPELQSKLPGSGRITGRYTEKGAQGLVTVLQSGSLSVTPEEVSSFVVGPGLGEDAVRRGGLSIAIATALVLLFMAIYYRGAGWVANFAVVLNLVMTLGVLLFLDATLSLPGIAGLILTLAMAVDANILVNERIREEKAAGKGLLQAISAGYDRAFVTIVDSNLTTIITGAILYWVGTGPIKGFALTLILGLVISMFTALYVTRTLFLWGLEKGILTEFRMMPAFASKFPFMASRARMITVSLVLIVLGTAAFAIRPEHDKYDLEFTGGQRVILSFTAPLTINDVKDRIGAAKLGEVQVRTIKARGSSSEDISLSSASDRFEVTAQLSGENAREAEKSGREFTGKVEALFAKDLVPHPISELKIEGAEGQPDRPFAAVLNVAGEGVDPEAVRAKLSAARIVTKPEGLKVEKGPAAGPGISSLKVTGTTSAAGDLTFREEVMRALKAPLDVRAATGLPQDEQALDRIRRAAAALEPSEPIPQSDFIGPGVAVQLREQAMLAVLLSILAQIAYLRFRFRDFTYGFAAAVALMHDVLITLGAVAVCDALGLAHVKINLPVIAAFLTLIGYSMNDTIVVFDRIRENLGRSEHPSSSLIDSSINQTLARSIRTSLTVFLAALTLFLVNYGATSSLEGFAFVMVVGVVTGTYSSVFIASPLLLFLPVYVARLAGLGKAPVYALVACLAAGLAVAFAAEGTVALVGAFLACILPAHFLWHLLRWLPEKDPDGLVRKLDAASPRRGGAALAGA